jgi:two-component system cell cycle response regulator
MIEHGYEVTAVGEPLEAAERALSEPPDIVVTDLWMPVISGVQLCRLLRAEPRTSHVPVVLITSESHRRSRFWARTAGAAGFVSKDDSRSLFVVLGGLAEQFPPRPAASLRPASRTPMQQRLFQQLDAALFESVIVAEVRALGHTATGVEGVFQGVVNLTAEITAYRWLALQLRAPSRVFVHAHPDTVVAAEQEVRTAFGVLPGTDVTLLTDERAVPGAPNPAVCEDVRSAGSVVGAFGLVPGARGASREDRELVVTVAAELSGPLHVVSLIEQTRLLAMTDPLTGLLNRRAFTDVLRRSLAELERHAQPISLLLLDVDHFKQVNDTHGHEGGDNVLLGVAGLLQRFARRTDFVGRWGGEEFVVGLAHTGHPAAKTPAERLRVSVVDHRFRLPQGAEIHVTASIGVVTAEPGEPVDQLIARADRAMYLAKSRGRNRCEQDDQGA